MAYSYVSYASKWCILWDLHLTTKSKVKYSMKSWLASTAEFTVSEMLQLTMLPWQVYLTDRHTAPRLVTAPPLLISWGSDGHLQHWKNIQFQAEPEVCDGFMDFLCPAASTEQCPCRNEVPFPGFSVCINCRTWKIALIDLLPTHRECSQSTFLLLLLLLLMFYSSWKWNKNFSCWSLQLCLVLFITAFVPKAKTEYLCPFGESRTDCVLGQTTYQTELASYMLCFHFLANNTGKHSQCSFQAELKDRFLMYSASQHQRVDSFPQ